MKLNNMTWLAGLLVWLAAGQTGLCFYSPATGKWLSRDPFGETAGMLLYAIVENNPVGQHDALGDVTVTQVAQIGSELGIRHAIVETAARSGFSDLDEATLIQGDFTGLIKLIQNKLGVNQDGDFGAGTVAAYERRPGARVVLRSPMLAQEVHQMVAWGWPASSCECPFGMGLVLSLIHYESMDTSTSRNGVPTYFNAVGGPASSMAGGKRIGTTAVGLGQFTIATAPQAGLTYQERYDAQASVAGVLRLLYKDAETHDCNFMSRNRGLNRWEAWGKHQAAITQKGSEIDKLIAQKKGVANVSNAELMTILLRSR